jgi:hypothetical protein
MSENLWRQNLTIRLISEPLRMFTCEDSIAETHEEMKRKNWSEAVFHDKSDAHRIFTFERDSLVIAKNWDEVLKRDINSSKLISQDCAIRVALKRIIEEERLFVLSDEGVTHIVTVADLNKQAAQFMAFGIVQDLETELLATIRRELEEDQIHSLLQTHRVKFEKVFELQKHRETRGQDLHLSDCLTLTHKRELIHLAGLQRITMLFGDSKKKFENKFKTITDLRNNLAHGQSAGDLNGGWGFVLSSLEDVERITKNLAAHS